ncbi:MAG: hypothetical protein KGI54_17340, partial [Pseudomonadota bacterium]|nr:hypothetical protein [Pseudomonadota bacterium]
YTVKLHEVDDSGNVTKVKDVECLGSTETIVHIIQKGVGGKVTGVKDMKAVTSVIEIYSSYTRDEILNAKAVSKPKSEKEKLEILKAASEIAKEGGFEELMEKLKK